MMPTGSEYSCNTSVSHVSDQDDQNLSDVNGADEDDDDEVEDRPAARREEKPVAPEKPVVPDRFELYKQRKAEQERKRQEEVSLLLKHILVPKTKYLTVGTKISDEP